jgi:hypothetical protein
MTRTKPIASLSLDLDDKWAYMRTHGDPDWESFPSYLNVLVPRVLDFLRRRGLTITFFVVGQDAALDRNRGLLAAIAADGHEIGNHSFSHEQWLHLYSEQEVQTELARAEEHIERATARRPVGFRGPGFSLSHATLKCLVQRGYIYDASTFPTFIGPLARAYYFRTAQLVPEQLRQRQRLYGSLWDAFRPLDPYRWDTELGTLLELPVTTMPVFRVPIHMSYILYLGLFNPELALCYFKTAMKLCSITGTQPSLLLHPLDFLGIDDVKELSFFPAMRVSSTQKLALLTQVISAFSDRFRVVTMEEHAQEALQRAKLELVQASVSL